MAQHDAYQLAQAHVRDHDRDRYYATLFAPATSQKHLFALYAFNAEIAGVRAKISEPMPGEIRLQWWRDALTNNAADENPLAQALLQTVQTFSLEPLPLIRLIDARRFDLYDDPMGDLNQFEGYAGETCSILFQYAAMILNGGKNDSFADAAGHAGVAYALTGLLRAVPVHGARGQIFLPKDILAANKVKETDLLQGKQTPPIQAALAQCRTLARDHFAQAQSHISNLPKNVQPAFKPLSLVPYYLTRLDATKSSELTNWQKLWHLWRSQL